MLVIIAGSRHFHHMEVLELAIQQSGFSISCVLSGGAKGVDQLGERWAQRRGIGVRTFLADWDRYSRAAGPIRNREMAEVAEGLIVLPCPCSRGSRDMMRAAELKAITTFIMEVDCGKGRKRGKTGGAV